MDKMTLEEASSVLAGVVKEWEAARRLREAVEVALGDEREGRERLESIEHQIEERRQALAGFEEKLARLRAEVA